MKLTPEAHLKATRLALRAAEAAVGSREVTSGEPCARAPDLGEAVGAEDEEHDDRRPKFGRIIEPFARDSSKR
jgi:hypothetical protein